MVRPFELLDGCARRFGGCFTLRPRLFPPMVVVSDPQDVRAVFAADPPRSLASAPPSALDPNRLMKPIFGETSFVFREGADLDSQRRLMTPIFSGPAAMRHGGAIAHLVEEAIDSWPRERPFRLHRRIKETVLRILLRATVGSAEPKAEAEAERLTLRLLAATDSPMTLLALSLAADNTASPLRRLPGVTTAIEAREAVLGIYTDEAQRRAATPLPGDASLLGHVVQAGRQERHQLSGREIAEMLHSMILGHETAAAGISWALADLIYEPVAAATVREELLPAFGYGPPGLEELAALPYLHAAVQESLRRHPVLGWVWRTLDRPLELAGHLVPKGVVVLPTLHLAHQDGRQWDDPGRFRPERFLNGPVDPAAFFPFGGGRHGCPGAGLAIPMIKYFVVRTLQRLELRPVAERFPGRHLDVATSSPAGGLLVVAADRPPADAGPPGLPASSPTSSPAAGCSRLDSRLDGPELQEML